MNYNRNISGNEREQIRFCFKVYDLTGKGFIAKEEMTTLMQKCLNNAGQEEEGEDGIKVGNLNFYRSDEMPLVYY